MHGILPAEGSMNTERDVDDVNSRRTYRSIRNMLYRICSDINCPLSFWTLAICLFAWSCSSRILVLTCFHTRFLRLPECIQNPFFDTFQNPLMLHQFQILGFSFE